MFKAKRVIKQAMERFIDFSNTLPERQRSKNPNPETIQLFINYLNDISRGGGAASTYTRFKKVMTQAVKDGILSSNQCIGIHCPTPHDCFVKNILSEHEIAALLKTHIERENDNIRRAFIFCLYTGLRFCDVYELKYSNLDIPNQLLSFIQSKTGRYAHIPLRSDLIQLTIQSQDTSISEDRLFHLPSHPTCLKELRKWTKAAGINKHITWHSARHTFATNILKNGADIRVVASLLGHRSLRYVERYTRAIDAKRYDAVNSLPSLF